MDPSAAYPQVHDWGPWIFHISGNIGLRWYGTAYLAGIILGYLLIRRWWQQKRFPLAPKEIADAAMFLALGMIIGGRLAYCLFYYTTWSGPIVVDAPPFAFLKDPTYLFRLWEGGMASHGGIVGMFAGAWLYCWRKGVKIWILGDAVAAVAGIGVAFGRLANYINGELYGRVTDVSWGVKFPDSIRPPPPDIARYSEAWYRYVDTYAPARHPSQLYAMVLEGIMVAAVALIVHRLHRRPGLTIGATITTYAIGRFIGEFWREPDPGYDLLLALSKGQWLTMPLFALGLGFLIFGIMRKPQPDWYLPSTPPEPKVQADLDQKAP
jgi:phosphatidylglycerol:prolipoprotein diacylglycerol transferase